MAAQSDVWVTDNKDGFRPQPVQSAALAQADTLRMLSSWPQNQLYNVNVTAHVIDKVQELSNGDLTIALDGPDVVPPLDQIEPVQAGVFDMLLTHPAYHVGTTTIGLGIKGPLPDAALRRSSRVFDTLDAHDQSAGSKVVSVVPFGSVAFNFILKEPIAEAPSFDGRKLRGTPFLNPVIEDFGAAPATMEDAATYMETTTFGRIDARIETEEKALIVAGMQATEFPTEDAARLNSMLSQGAWALASKSGPAAEKMKEQAIARGLTE